MIETPRPLVSPLAVFVAAAIFGLAFALATEHAWEDYYITYRSSKNLATGNGLAHNPGERLHTFTSPLGVLLPAGCYLLTGNSSDEAALWIFRVLCLGAFAGGAALVYSAGLRLGFHRGAVALLAAWLITDAKSLNHTIDGMETGLLLFFIAYAVWAGFVPGSRRALHLGMAWAGLMWTRPDSFVYIGALGLGLMLFGSQGRSGVSRKDWLRICLAAGAVCTVLYLPWFVFAWWYYGTPIPHTILAKAGYAGTMSFPEVIAAVIKLPVTCWFGRSSIEHVFAPVWTVAEGCPEWVIAVSRAVGWAAMYLWVLPVLRWQTRVVSFMCWAWMSYLACRPDQMVCSWYVPGGTWLAFITLGFVLAQWLDVKPAGTDAPASRFAIWRVSTGRLAMAAGVALLVFSGWITWHSGKHARLQQALTNGGLRRDLGEWLKEHAAPGDRVLMEPLGYIGYYSNLRTYDMPGLSSPEVVRAAREEKYVWIKVIDRLKPEWLALRPVEVFWYSQADPSVLRDQYEIVTRFDVSAETAALDIHGRGLLTLDSVFFVFRRIGPPAAP